MKCKKESIIQVKSTIKADAVIKIEIRIYHGKTARCSHRYSHTVTSLICTYQQQQHNNKRTTTNITE